MQDVIISGMKSSQPFDSSAMRKIEVRGAFMTPDMTPAMPHERERHEREVPASEVAHEGP